MVRGRDAASWGEDDPKLAALVGRRVTLTGSIVAGTMLVDELERLD